MASALPQRVRRLVAISVGHPGNQLFNQTVSQLPPAFLNKAWVVTNMSSCSRTAWPPHLHLSARPGTGCATGCQHFPQSYHSTLSLSPSLGKWRGACRRGLGRGRQRAARTQLVLPLLPGMPRSLGVLPETPTKACMPAHQAPQRTQCSPRLRHMEQGVRSAHGLACAGLVPSALLCPRPISHKGYCCPLLHSAVQRTALRTSRGADPEQGYDPPMHG